MEYTLCVTAGTMPLRGELYMQTLQADVMRECNTDLTGS